MRKFSADWVFPVSSAPLPQAVVVTDDQGKILAIEPRERHDPAGIDIRSGALIPGFVNTHCHLELSHMKGKVDTGTGLIPFITGVVTQRNAAAELIQDAIERAEADMLAGGIVAVGDISNVPDTFAVKSRGRLRWYTFVELFDFLQDAGADKTFGTGKAVFDQLLPAPGSAKALVPHAPYSVSARLFEKINTFNPASGTTLSIHNQETPPENELFLLGTGAFRDFYSR
ncbi:MAG TPA: amidohydrolase family protein, partial [Saprospiraceae bacterium]|nr:amidohydrolase family protein [Saprospiraceae bacterium]